MFRGRFEDNVGKQLSCHIVMQVLFIRYVNIHCKLLLSPLLYIIIIITVIVIILVLM